MHQLDPQEMLRDLVPLPFETMAEIVQKEDVPEATRRKAARAIVERAYAPQAAPYLDGARAYLA